MPPLLIWSPLEQYPGSIHIVCPKCKKDLNAIDWCDGHTARHCPRLIHDINSCCLLVSRIYKCKDGHEILGHHSEVLSQFHVAACSSLIPFRLYHKTGFTVAFISYVTSTLNLGVTLHELERLVVDNRVQSFHF